MISKMNRVVHAGQIPKACNLKKGPHMYCQKEENCAEHFRPRFSEIKENVTYNSNIKSYHRPVHMRRRMTPPLAKVTQSKSGIIRMSRNSQREPKQLTLPTTLSETYGEQDMTLMVATRKTLMERLSRIVMIVP
jgi:hypothetical protein